MKQATDFICSKNTYRLDQVIKEQVLYYLQDGPNKAFVREELIRKFLLSGLVRRSNHALILFDRLNLGCRLVFNKIPTQLSLLNTSYSSKPEEFNLKVTEVLVGKKCQQ